MSKKILIVDDDATNRKLLATILKKGGYEPIEAENGLEALNKLTPDIKIILLDLIMPLMGGLEFLEIFPSKKPECMNIPVLVLTTDDSKKTEALHKGAKEVIIKPINPTLLLDKISSYL
ncbi:two-component system, chemotaxis family, response regulator CheY [Lebetimonas natsushimae]|uniref:Two-component system, chemotaxis family, response regulator CheY n=1 Tax=Lebetimonas natsushimae TaxID=1936991 RepID=A0A292YD74_9BACT|nr:response regulator [Lebetimonas natsushimae]GAX87280.1 two-component system, chemotaxis family, response regulator CheY [Lebetimonas natsushimae]